MSPNPFQSCPHGILYRVADQEPHEECNACMDRRIEQRIAELELLRGVLRAYNEADTANSVGLAVGDEVGAISAALGEQEESDE